MRLFVLRFIGSLIATNIYIALVATAVATPGIVLFNPHYQWVNLGFVFVSTMLAYTLQRYFKWRTGNMPVFLQAYAFNHRSWMLLMVPLALATLALFVLMRPLHQWLLAGITCITGLYLFIHPFSGKLSGLRFIPFAKTLVVAFCWTALFIITCITPQPWNFMRQTWPYWLLVFLQVWQSCLLFDIRDIETDRRHGVKTFANVLSKRAMLVLWLAVSAIILALSFSPHHFRYPYVLAFYAFALVLQLLCLFRPMNGIVFTFLLDGSLVPYAAGNFLLLS